MAIPTAQSPHISSTATTAIPALGVRIERESATNANQRLDLLGCLVEQVKLTGSDGEKFQWEVSGKVFMVLPGVTTITSHAAERTDNVFGWEHFSLSTFTYNSQTVAFTPTDFTLTINVEWEPIKIAAKATTYLVYTDALFKHWDCKLEMTGMAYEDGTKSSVHTIARTAVASYATALALTFKLVRTANTDEIEFGFDKWELDMDEMSGEHDSSDYETVSLTLVPAESSTLTCHAHDAYAKALYGGAT